MVKKKLTMNRLNEYQDDELPLNILVDFPIMAVIIRSNFEEDSKYHPQFFLDECLYEL